MFTIPTSAQDERGRLHFQAGASYFEAGDYEDALREFQRAYELSHRPELFYNLSLCYQHLGDLEQAALHLEHFLDSATEISNRANLERRLANFHQRLENEPTESETEETTSETNERKVNIGMLTGYSIAGVGLLTFGISGVLAIIEKGNLDSDPCSETSTCDAGRLRIRSVVADIGLGITLAGAALGTLFFFLHRVNPEQQESATFRLEPYASPRELGANLEFQF